MARGSILTQNKIAQIKYLRSQGYKQTEIAYNLGISQWAVSTVLKEKRLIDRELYDRLIKGEEDELKT